MKLVFTQFLQSKIKTLYADTISCVSLCLSVTVNNIRNNHFRFICPYSNITLCVNKLDCVLVNSFVNFYFPLGLLMLFVIVRARQQLIKIYFSFHAV